MRLIAQGTEAAPSLNTFPRGASHAVLIIFKIMIFLYFFEASHQSILTPFTLIPRYSLSPSPLLLSALPFSLLSPGTLPAPLHCFSRPPTVTYALTCGR